MRISGLPALSNALRGVEELMSKYAARVSPAARFASALWVVVLAGCGGAEATHLISANSGAGGGGIPIPTGGDGGRGGSGVRDAAPDVPPTTVTPTCTDGVRNGAETDVDCGGGDNDSGCPKCHVGQACTIASDCENGVCTNSFCQPAGCADLKQNGTETDVDCGGVSCAACPDGDSCLVGTDCQSGTCTAGKCQGPRCDDGVKNGTESDVDCGGTCPGCATGETCNGAADCQSAICNTKCQPASCGDGIRNGSETDIDCGGTCPACVVGKTCAAGTDCQTGVCAVTCQAPTCQDGVRNGLETDVDCGGNGGTPGSNCSACDALKRCLVNSDCISLNCVDMVCQATSCTDKLKNGTETDVDCGGGCATKCDVGKVCLVNADCSSAICTGGKCQSPWKVQYKCLSCTATTQQPLASLQIIGIGGATAPLTEFKMRYYFTRDGLGATVMPVGISYFAVVGNANITLVFGTLPTARPTADSFMEIGFIAAAGSLVSGASSGEVQASFHDPNSFATIFTQTNDYSFDATKTAFTDWTHVTLYHNGTLVWGAEP
jgi:hypothetical protein